MANADRETKIARGCVSTLGLVVFVLIMVASAFSGGDDNRSTSSTGDIRWKRYDVTIDVREDGTLHVTEHQEVFFDGSFREGYAAIPLERIEAISNVQVTTEGRPPDANGDGTLTHNEARADGEMIPAARVDESTHLLEPNQFRVKETGSELLIDYAFESTGSTSYFGSVEQIRTIILEYDVEGAIRDYPDAEEPWQQVHWMAISSEASEIAPVESATVTMTLPEVVEVETLAFAPEPDTIEGDRLVWSRSGLDDGEAFDVQAAFPAITAAVAPAWQPVADARDADAENAENRRALAGVMLIGATILTAVAGGLGVLYAWYTRIREAVPGLVPDRLSQPPDDLPAALVGALVDEEVHPRDVAAAVMDLERRGVVGIREADTAKDTSFGQHSAYEIELVQPDADLAGYERVIVEGIFGANAAPGTVRNFLALRALFGARRSDIQQAMDQELVDRGFLTELPATSRARWMNVLRGFVALTAMVAIGLLIWTRTWTWWAVLPPAAGVIVYIVGKRLTPTIARKTPLGAETGARWQAFQRYLESIRVEYFATEARGLNDKYLPWAVAFGLDHHWLSRMNAPGPVPASGGSSTSSTLGQGWSRVDRPTRHGSTITGGRRRWTPTGSSWRSWDAGSWADMQSRSDTVLSKLSNGSDSLFSMLGDAMEAMGESAGSGGGSAGGRSRGARRSSRSGGGRSRSSSGGGRRGFR